MSTPGLQDAAPAREAGSCAAPAGMAAARESCSQKRTVHGEAVRLGAGWSRSVATNLETKSKPRNSGMASRRAARCRRRGGLIREEIIGHRMCSVRARFRPGDVVRDLPGTFALLHQPARQHGRSVFLQPLVEQGIDLLAEIGGMTQARQFVGLQRIARSGQQKLPRRLRVVPGHGILLCGRGLHSNTMVITFKDNHVVNGCGKLWKTFEGLRGRDGGAHRRQPLKTSLLS
jgi:hypothetical protein